MRIQKSTPAKHISRTVWVLSLVSLCTDIASEMLYPVMPLYLKSIGFSVVLIGVLEGFAEATAGLSKGYFGHRSDASGRRLPLVQLGYSFSALSKPLMALFTWPLWVFSARTLDRLGKGLRTGARDALLSQEATSSTKARVFGFHRGMDTLGAAIGPILALVYLHYYPGQYKWLFFLAFIPGLMGVFATFLVDEKQPVHLPPKQKVGFFSFLKYLPQSSRAYRWLLVGLLAFTLVNSSDIFLLLMLKQRGFSDYDMIGVYIFYNLVYAVFAYPFGILADKIGLKKIFISGLVLFGITYLGMAFATAWLHIYTLFFIYGIYAASTEGVSKAWISNISNQEDMGRAIGSYEGLRSITTFLASSIAGLVWVYVSPEAMFGVTVLAVLFIGIYFMRRL